MTAGSVALAPPDRRKDFERFAGLIRISALRSLKVRYRGSFLGILWSFSNPVLMTVMYTAVFGTTFAKYYGGSIVNYLVSAFVGLAVVTFFLNTTSEALLTVVANGGLLNKIALPPAVFPLSSVASNIFQQLCTTFPVVFIISVLVTHDIIRIVLVPFVLLGLVLLTTGFSLALASLYVFFRDLSYLWGIVGFVLWMTSPLFYPAAVVPEKVRVWIGFNPVSQQLSALREVAIGTGRIDYGGIAVALGGGIVACVLGAVVFRATRRDFMDLL